MDLSPLSPNIFHRTPMGGGGGRGRVKVKKNRKKRREGIKLNLHQKIKTKLTSDSIKSGEHPAFIREYLQSYHSFPSLLVSITNAAISSLISIIFLARFSF